MKTTINQIKTKSGIMYELHIDGQFVSRSASMVRLVQLVKPETRIEATARHIRSFRALLTEALNSGDETRINELTIGLMDLQSEFFALATTELGV